MSNAKIFVDTNVWDGQDRSGASNDEAKFNPDELQELVDDMLDSLGFKELERKAAAFDYLSNCRYIDFNNSSPVKLNCGKYAEDKNLLEAVEKAMEDMCEYKPCPCGKDVDDIYIIGDGRPKHAYASCPCGEWLIEFRNHYAEIDSKEAKENAKQTWNAAPRSE